jgi:hypothetical protein
MSDTPHNAPPQLILEPQENFAAEDGKRLSAAAAQPRLDETRCHPLTFSKGTY